MYVLISFFEMSVVVGADTSINTNSKQIAVSERDSLVSKAHAKGANVGNGFSSAANSQQFIIRAGIFRLAVTHELLSRAPADWAQ